ncbi:MAG: hypothetical protein ACE37F_09855 [Nannocystaceae bacterium]|nr:metal-binding protein ZinT [bacterium]
MLLLRGTLFVTGLGLSACTTAQESSGDGALGQWQGQWRAGEGLLRDDALDPVYEIVSEMRPEYPPGEVRALMIESAEVDYDVVEFDGDVLTFLVNAQPLCSGTYAFVETHEGGHHAQTEFSLSHELAGDCTDYATVWLSEIIFSESEAHFHIQTGRSDEPLRPPPWDPSAWTMSTSPEFFAGVMHGVAPAIAEALPEKG